MEVSIMKLEETAFAKAHAILAGVAYLVCVIAVSLFPNLTIWVFNSWFHGLDISALPVKTGSLGTVVFGLLTLTGVAWAWGYILAAIYNRTLAKK